MTFSDQKFRPAALKIKTLLVDDCEIVRTSLVKLIETIPAIELVGIAATGFEAIELAAEKRPQLVVMDFQMPGLNGLETTRMIRDLHPATRVILMSAHDLSLLGDCHGASGADAFIPKESLFNELKETIFRLFSH